MVARVVGGGRNGNTAIRPKAQVRVRTGTAEHIAAARMLQQQAHLRRDDTAPRSAPHYTPYQVAVGFRFPGGLMSAVLHISHFALLLSLLCTGRECIASLHSTGTGKCVRAKQHNTTESEARAHGASVRIPPKGLRSRKDKNKNRNYLHPPGMQLAMVVSRALSLSSSTTPRR